MTRLDATYLLEPLVLAAGFASLTGLALASAAGLVAALRHRPVLDVAGRWVVVTGCDSGIGEGVAATLAARGAKVIACCLTDEGAAAAVAAGAACAQRFDLTDEEAIVRAAREIESLCGGSLWALVHNAGVVLPGFVDYLPMSFFRDVMEVNYFAPVRLTKALLPSVRRGGGRVVFVSSVDGIVSLPGNAAYDASKFAIEGYADALRAELSFGSIEVSVVNPATMRTPLAMGFFEAHRRAWEASDRLDPDGDWKAIYPKSWLDDYVHANAANLDFIAQDPSLAVLDIVHAVTAVRPRHRYLSGTLAKTVFYALWVAPESWALAFKRATIRPSPPGTPIPKPLTP